jgi:hypothetical protein
MYTCRVNSGKTMIQKMVSVITSANCLNESSSAFMVVFRPVGMKLETSCSYRLKAHVEELRKRLLHAAVPI